MEFCDVCENMLNLTIDKSDGKLKHTCKFCASSKNVGNNFNPCVHKTNYGGNEKIFFEMFINEYTFIDPTLPRSKNIHCPHCVNNDQTKSTEVIYVRYNDSDMKYIYLCCACKNAWITPEYEKNKSITMDSMPLDVN